MNRDELTDYLERQLFTKSTDPLDSWQPSHTSETDEYLVIPIPDNSSVAEIRDALIRLASNRKLDGSINDNTSDIPTTIAGNSFEASFTLDVLTGEMVDSNAAFSITKSDDHHLIITIHDPALLDIFKTSADLDDLSDKITNYHNSTFYLDRQYEKAMASEEKWKSYDEQRRLDPYRVLATMILTHESIHQIKERGDGESIGMAVHRINGREISHRHLSSYMPKGFIFNVEVPEAKKYMFEEDKTSCLYDDTFAAFDLKVPYQKISHFTVTENTPIYSRNNKILETADRMYHEEGAHIIIRHKDYRPVAVKALELLADPGEAEKFVQAAADIQYQSELPMKETISTMIRRIAAKLKLAGMALREDELQSIYDIAKEHENYSYATEVKERFSANRSKDFAQELKVDCHDPDARWFGF